MTTIYTVQQHNGNGQEIFSSLKAAKFCAEYSNKPYIESGTATKLNLYYIIEWHSGFPTLMPNGKVQDSKFCDAVYHIWNTESKKWERFNA